MGGFYSPEPLSSHRHDSRADRGTILKLQQRRDPISDVAALVPWNNIQVDTA